MNHFLRTHGKSQKERLVKRGGDGLTPNLRGSFTVGWLSIYQIIHLKYVLFIFNCV